jgi:hypothetical protein
VVKATGLTSWRPVRLVRTLSGASFSISESIFRSRINLRQPDLPQSYSEPSPRAAAAINAYAAAQSRIFLSGTNSLGPCEKESNPGPYAMAAMPRAA